MNAASVTTPSQSLSDRFLRAWVRGWRVIVLTLWLQLIGLVLSLPFKLLPPNWSEGLMAVVGLIIGPPLSYWGFKCLYPDPEQRTDPNSLPTECLTCKTTIPAHADTCPSCGWSYKRR